MIASTDRIEKRVILRAPQARVWRAITDARRFGTWFGAEFDGPFAAGARLGGRIVPTQVDPEVAELQEPHRGTRMEIFVERIEPMRVFSFRWHPYSVDETADHSHEPMTLVTFELTPVEDGTELTITESGFDQIPLERRAQAFRSNEGGWTAQLGLIAKYLDRDTE